MSSSVAETRKIKVLVVDDSAIVRRILAETISLEPDMVVVGTAPDASVAAEKISALTPDVLTLDLEMPGMNGLTFLKQIMQQHPIPTLIISALGQSSCAVTLEALRCGAIDVIAKPSGPYSVSNLRATLAARIRSAAIAKPRIGLESPASAPVANYSAPRRQHDPRAIIAIGASTGGTAAIQEIVQRFSADIPPMVICQHIPAKFSLAFANRLNQLCAVEVREAVDGELLHPGLALVAPGDYHLLVRRAPTGYRVELHQGPHICYQRPSVDVMFASVAQAAGRHGVGVLLTGMGSDGAKGMLALKRTSATTIAQDEQTCVVYGMPREAVRLGAATVVAPLAKISGLIARAVERQPVHPPSGSGNNLQCFSKQSMKEVRS